MNALNVMVLHSATIRPVRAMSFNTSPFFILWQAGATRSVTKSQSYTNVAELYSRDRHRVLCLPQQCWQMQEIMCCSNGRFSWPCAVFQRLRKLHAADPTRPILFSAYIGHSWLLKDIKQNLISLPGKLFSLF